MSANLTLKQSVVVSILSYTQFSTIKNRRIYMKINVPDADTKIPDWLRQHVKGINVVAFNEEFLPYLVVDKELEPKLTGFVSYRDGLLFVSEEVPHEFRHFVLSHELIELRELDGLGGHCKRALKEELALVPPAMFQRYITYRRDFFRNLVTYYQDGRRSTPEFRAEIAQSLKYLEDLF